MRTFLLEVLMHPFFRSRYPIVLVALALASATPGVAQDTAIPRNQIAVDVGILQGGLSYARRVSQKFSVGGGVWGAWEPWSSFESNVLERFGAVPACPLHPGFRYPRRCVRRLGIHARRALTGVCDAEQVDEPLSAQDVLDGRPPVTMLHLA
jgi:hypothetical protein